MLIIKIKNEEAIKKKKKFRKRRKIFIKDVIERRSIKIDNNVHTLVNVPVSCCGNPEFSRLIKTYKGRIISPDNEAINDILNEYRFDTKPYLKRAVLSAFVKYMGNDFKNYKTVCIADSDFQITQEIADVAKFARNLIIVSDNAINTQRFSDICYFNLGTFISVKNQIDSLNWDVFFNLDEISEDGKIILKFKGVDAVLHPDPDYFVCNGEFADIISYGIPVKTVCAAFEVKKQDEIKWGIK